VISKDEIGFCYSYGRSLNIGNAANSQLIHTHRLHEIWLLEVCVNLNWERRFESDNMESQAHNSEALSGAFAARALGESESNVRSSNAHGCNSSTVCWPYTNRDSLKQARDHGNDLHARTSS
jgi:hypothetical protein